MAEEKTFPLGRNPSPFDARDYDLRSFIPIWRFEVEKKESDWNFPHPPLNQGDAPHCVGFSGASWGINEPTHTDRTNEDGHRYYYACKVIDGEPGEENGSYVRSIAKVLKAEGCVDAYAFASDMETIKYWLLYKGPMIVGTIWTKSMFAPDESNVVHPDDEVVGGHAYLINEWRADNYIGIQNSWGAEWGNNGKAYISEDDFKKIFIRGGEALAAVEIEKPVVQAKKECWLVKFFRKIFSN